MTSLATEAARPEARRARRSSRYEALAVLWEISSRSRVRGCRRFGVLADGAATVRVGEVGGENRAGFGGMAVCGNVWACPCCSEKIMAGRQEEIAAVIKAWTATGGRVALVTLTMRHDAGQRLKLLWDSLADAWHKTTSGRAWETAQDKYGAPVERVITQGKRRGEIVTENRIGWVRVVETTVGEAGWHVHVHAALLIPGTVDAKTADELGCDMFQRWRDALVRNGLAAPLARHGGLDVSMYADEAGDGSGGRLANYFTKNVYRSSAERAAMEIGRGDLKRARGNHRTPFQVLTDIVENFHASDGDLWREWEKASKGRRQIGWSAGLRQRMLLEPEQTDEELAEATVEGETLLVLTRRGLVRIAKLGIASEILSVTETNGRGGLVLVLDHYGIDWHPVTDEWLADSRNRRATPRR